MDTIRPIRSFILRQGRLTKSQKNAIDNFGKDYLVDFSPSQVDLNKIFHKKKEIIFEIGFGMGGATHQIIKQNTMFNYLASDVHLPGIGNLIKLCNEDSLQNIKIIQHDATEILKTMMPDNFLAGINIFFPDPWHKKRHNKRRLINQDTLQLFSQKLKPGSTLHIATDWEPYAIEIIDLIERSSDFSFLNENFHIRPIIRPETKYESRGTRLGHQVWDILAARG
jgi:tRNA (guanine-N7-)-methyltransferase